MIYSELIANNTLYLSLHVEQVYHNFGCFNTDKGIFDNELTLETIESVTLCISSKTNLENVLIDCKGIEESLNTAVEFKTLIDTFISKNISVSIIRIAEKLYEDLKFHKYKLGYCDAIKESIGTNCFNIFINTSEIETDNYDDLIDKLYEEQFSENLVLNLLEKNTKKYSDSSNVYLPKYINIKRFIENKSLLYIGIYLLCKRAINECLIPKLEVRGTKLKENITEKSQRIETPIIFFQSLNGAYLASIFSKLAVLDMAYIDHIGPINKIYQTILKTNFKQNKEYIIISDVVCMGTEIQIAKNLMDYNNSVVNGNVAIVKIEVIKGKKELKTISLFKLDEQKNRSIKYKIKTEFK